MQFQMKTTSFKLKFHPGKSCDSCFIFFQVRMVSQGAQTNGMNGKKLTKSYSEMGTGVDAGCQYEEG